MKKALGLTLIIIAAVVILAAMTFGGIYNRLVITDETVKSAWGQVQNVYQRRLDLVPNLVETVKGYAAHEQETFQGVVDARAKISQLNLSSDIINDPELFAKFQQAQGNLSSTLSRLLAVVENYPDLKASANFLALQTQLEGTENRVAVERHRYNETARAFNTLRRVFPNVVVANVMGFKEKAYFQADEGAAKAPAVKF
jgi:LemA protein